MINIVIESFLRFLKQPTLLAPAIFMVIVQAILIVLFFSFSDTLPRFYYELFVLNIFPEAPLFETILLILLSNLQELFYLVVAMVLWVASSLWMVFSFTNFASNNESPLKSTFSPVKHLGKIIGLSIFLGIILLLYFFIMGLILWIGILYNLELISFAGLIIWILVGVFLFFKLIFLPVEFFSKEQKITKAIKNIWSWNSKHFFSIVVFIIIVSIISNLITTIGISISDLIPIEEISIIIIFLALAFSSGYFSYSLVNYYFSHN